MTDATNPYWLAEEPAPHPSPEKGCIGRGLCCRSSPGWFAPGEVEAAAAHLSLTPDAFVREFAVIDGIEVDGERVEVFVPVKLDRFGEPAWTPGTRVDAWYGVLRGPCVFYRGKAVGCGIYPVRPTECAEYICTKAPEDNPTHVGIAKLWRQPKP
ncbi:MAG: Fe-S-cluster containining protein [Myxococcota bacterium]|jgi:Fe-S-cluster containining protein